MKLNDLVASVKRPSSRLIAVKDLTEVELQTCGFHYRKLAEIAKKEKDFSALRTLKQANELCRKKYHKG